MTTSGTTAFAYLHCLPDGAPFYVGKGKRVRAFNFHHRSEYYKNVVKKHGGAVQVGLLECSTEAAAFALERGLIKCLRRSGVRLCNLTAGGEGPSGMVATAATRAKQRASKLGHTLTAAHKANIGAALRGRKVAPEAVEKTRRGLLGKKLTPEHRAKLVACHKGKIVSAETRAKLSAANAGKTLSAEHKAKIGASNKGGISPQCRAAAVSAARKGGRKHSHDTKEKIRATMLRTLAEKRGA